MMSFIVIKYYYQKGWWNKSYVANMVAKKMITAKQYKEITGEDYKEETEEK